MTDVLVRFKLPFIVNFPGDPPGRIMPLLLKVPGTVITAPSANARLPLFVTLGAPVTMKAPLPIDEFVSDSATLVSICTSLLPVLLNETSPLKLLPTVVKVMRLAPALKLLLPVTLSTPD